MADKADSTEQAETVEPESTEPSTQGEIVYPDGALTFGKDKLASSKYLSTKNGLEEKPFIKNARLVIEINGREMTRLEAVEEIAKGNLDESAMKLNTGERDYLKWLQRHLIEPLKAIRQAGIQNERADNIYRGMFDGKSVYFEDSKNNAATLEQLTKLAKVFGGTAQKNQSGNTRFKFTTQAGAWEFIRNAEFFMDNRHVEYFNPDSARKRKNTLASIKKFIENTRTELYELTEAEKYPSSKNYIDDILGRPFDNLMEAKKEIKSVLSSCREYLNNGGDTAKLAARTLFKQQYPGYGYPGRLVHKRRNSEYILQAMDAGKFTGEQALRYLNTIFNGELIGDNRTDEQIIEAAKNRYVADLLKPWDIWVKDGKIKYPSESLLKLVGRDYSMKDLRTNVSNRLEILKMVTPTDEMYYDWETQYRHYWEGEGTADTAPYAIVIRKQHDRAQKILEQRKQGNLSEEKASDLLYKIIYGDRIPVDERIAEYKFKYDDTKSIEENLHQAEILAQEYLDTFGDRTEILSPKRIDLRYDIIEELYGNGAQQKDRKAFLVMGLPVSGKSSAVAEPVAKENGALIIDSDMAKEKLPEFNGGVFASAVHNESSLIANRILGTALENGDNVVLPIVGSVEEDVQRKIEALKEAGYEVYLYHVDLPLEKAIERAKERFKKTGRLVSPKYIASVGLKPKKNYDKLKTQEGVDGYGEWSNDVAYGQRPRLLEQSEKSATDESGLVRRNLHDRRLDGMREEKHGATKVEGNQAPENKVENQRRREDTDGFFDDQNQETEESELADVIADNMTVEYAPSGRKRTTNEIFTPPDVVQYMLDELEKDDPTALSDPTKTFIDPAAGEGAMTIKVLAEKLKRHATLDGKTPEKFHSDMLRALSTVYSVELLADNVEELKKNMRNVFLDHYRKQTGKDLNPKSELFKRMNEIIDANNIQGDSLELMADDGAKLDEAFRDWSDVSFDNVSADEQSAETKKIANDNQIEAVTKAEETTSEEKPLTTEEAQKQINEMIEKWVKKNPAYWNGAQPTLAKRLSRCMADGLITSDAAIITVNKLLNGTETEKKRAEKIYYDTVEKWVEKRIAEFDPKKAIARLNEIAKKFPVLKDKAESEIKRINDGIDVSRLINSYNLEGSGSLTGMDDDNVEQWATYQLLHAWSIPYSRQLNSFFTSSVATDINHKAYALYEQAQNGEIPTKGLYKRVEDFLNAPHEGILTDDEWGKQNAIEGRVKYLLAKNNGATSLQDVQRDLKKFLGKETADKIATQIEAVYDKLSKKKLSTVAKSAGQISRQNLETAFADELKDKSDSKLEVTRREIYDKLDKDKYPNLKKFLDEHFDNIYTGRFTDLSVNKLRKYDSQQIERLEQFLATSEMRNTPNGRVWLPSEKYLYEKFKTDTHPNLKKRIEDYFSKALYETDAKKSRSALADLEVLRRDDNITDEEIDRMESLLQEQSASESTPNIETAPEENRQTDTEKSTVDAQKQLKATEHKTSDPIEQRAREALKAAGLEGKGAFESRGFSTSTEFVSEGELNLEKRYSKVSIDTGKTYGLTTNDIKAYYKIAKVFDAQPIHETEFICDEKDAPALQRAFDIYLGNSVDERIKTAVEKLKAENDFTDEQLKWLDEIEQHMHRSKAYPNWETYFDFEMLNPDDNPFLYEAGGSEGLNKIFDGRLQEIVDELKSSVYDNRREANENVTDDGTRAVVERTGARDNQDALGRDDEIGQPRRGSVSESLQEIGEETRAQRGLRVQAGGTALSGETGDSRVQAEESTDNANRAGSAELSGSVRDNLARNGELDDGREAQSLGTAQDGRINEGAQRVNAPTEKVSYAAGDLESIRNDLPMLLPEQQEDVAFMEERLLNQGGTGILLSNGTGTGKTFSGLGLVKRFFDNGKKNILIVTPSEDVNRQWQKEAKKFFGLDVHLLENRQDKGTDNQICVTTYANFQANKEVALRKWDVVIADESHNLMQNKDADATGYLEMFRTLTLNPRNWYELWRLRNRTKEIRELEKQLADLQAKFRNTKNKSDILEEFESQSEKTRDKIDAAYRKMNDKWLIMKAELEKLNPADRPKAVFLSATPFAYDKCIDYAEGYLFNYTATERTGYNEGDARENFMIRNFGYRMRYNELTRPTAAVDNRVMEVQFHDMLVNSGVMRGRQIEVDADYDRGFLLVGSGIGKDIDAGFAWLQEQGDKYRELREVLSKQLDRRTIRYLLESIKAREAIPLVKKYLAQGKKVVLFHQAMREKENIEPFRLNLQKLPTENRNKILAQWKLFQSERPDLIKLNLRNLPSPMESFRKGFGNSALYINGSSEHRKGRKDAQTLFNDDNSGKNLIIVQQDAGNAGISLHDTTGKYQRVLINIALPERPSYAMQIEGRIYRFGSKSNAIIRYLATGTNLEQELFAKTIGGKAATVENLALGEAARGLREAFKNLYMEVLTDAWQRRKPGHKLEGTGGKETDSADKLNMTYWQRAISYYYAQAQKSAKTKAAEGKDYFATPEPIGLKMVEWLGLHDGERVLEPSAGHGAISRWFSPNTKNTIIEPSSFLSPLAQIVTPDAKVINGNFENFNIVNKFEGIVMNPPFGTGGKTAIEHLAKAYRHLSDGGRIIAIVPEGTQCDKRFDAWFYSDAAQDAVLTATIRLPNVAFQRAGTSVATKILVIDKLRNTNGRAKFSGYEHDFSGVKDINELFNRMEDLEIPERHAPTVKENPFADIEKDFREITTKEAKNGSKLYYIDGQRVKYKDAVNESLRQAQAKVDVLANMFREIFDVEENKYSNASVSVPFETAVGVDQPRANFNSLEDAINFARWLKQNYAETLWQDRYSQINVRANNSHETVFMINTASGEETSHTSAAKKIVDKLNAEENTVSNEPATAPSQSPKIYETSTHGGINFETGTFTHTKTGDKLAEAKLTNRLDKDGFKQLTSLAKKHHGGYSKFSQSFLFKSSKDRDAFVQEVQGESTQIQRAQPETSPTPSTKEKQLLQSESQDSEQVVKKFVDKIRQELSSPNNSKISEQIRQKFLANRQSVSTATTNNATMFRDMLYDKLFPKILSDVLEEEFPQSLPDGTPLASYISSHPEIFSQIQDELFPVVYESLRKANQPVDAQSESAQAQPTVADNRKFFETKFQPYGEEKPVASFKGGEFLDDLKTNELNSELLPSTRARLQELAQKHNGDLEPNGEYIFDTEQDRDAFVNEAVPIVRAEADSQKQRRNELTREFKSLGTEGFFETGKYTTVDGRTVIGVYVKPDALGNFDLTSGLSSTLTKKAEPYGGKRITLNKTQLTKAERTHKSFYYGQVTRADGTVIEPGRGLFLYFKTNKGRDKFISDTFDFLVQEAARRKHAVERSKRASEENTAVIEQRQKRYAEAKPKIDKIISDAKETAYDLLEADKYPELKEIVDDRFDGFYPRTIKDAQEIADKVLNEFRFMKERGNMVFSAADKLFWNWMAKHQNSRSDNVKATRRAANKLMNETRRQAGEISYEQLYEEISTLLNNAQKKFYRTEAQLNEAAKNPDTADAMKQLGAEISDGKVTLPDLATIKAVDVYLDAIKAPAPDISAQAQPETSPTPDFSNAEPLTDEEIENIKRHDDPKELVVDERLGATLYNKYPETSKKP